MSEHEAYDAGMGTTPGMWESLSDILAENNEKLPDPLNSAIYALRDGEAVVQAKYTASLNSATTGEIMAELLKRGVIKLSDS